MIVSATASFPLAILHHVYKGISLPNYADDGAPHFFPIDPDELQDYPKTIVDNSIQYGYGTTDSQTCRKNPKISFALYAGGIVDG